MTENEGGRCLIVPVGLSGLIAMWSGSVILVGVGTFGGVDGAAQWGLLCSAAAAAWTVVSALGRHRRMLMYAFEVGRETGEQSRTMRPVP